MGYKNKERENVWMQRPSGQMI